LFLHDRGYTFFNINKLTVVEINTLVRAFNVREAEKDAQNKKMRRSRK